MTEQSKRAYQTGFTDAETRTRKRAMGPMYRLAYTCGWFDRKLGRPCLYAVSE